MNTRSLDIINKPNSFIGKSPNFDSELGLNEGEFIKVKLLDYLGAGKVIIGFNGQRIVANTNFPLEKDDEINVFVKSVNDDKIILQIISNDELQNCYKQISKSSISDSILQLKNIISMIETPMLRDRLLRLNQMLDESIIYMADDIDKAELSSQIRNALNIIGYDYESKILRSLDNGEVIKPYQIKSMLLEIENFALEYKNLGELSEKNEILEKLFSSFGGLIESIESYQTRSIFQDSNSISFCFALPLFMDDRETSVEIDYTHKDRDSDNDGMFDISIRFDLDGLGKIEFSLNISDINLNCLIIINNLETHLLVKKHLGELKEGLLSLGYNLGSIYCMIKNPESVKRNQGINLIDTNI